MIKKKMCMLGAFAVGKSSLVGSFVRSMFSDKYLTTVGVKVDKKTVSVDGDDVTLLIWDIHGEDTVEALRPAYLRGLSGYLLVADGTRTQTLATARGLKEQVEDLMGPLPFVLLLNKADRAEGWQVDDNEVQALADEGWQVLKTSAKTGQGVEEAFQALARRLAPAR